MTSKRTAIVVGAGVMGASTARTLASRGLYDEILLIEQGDIPYSKASSYDQSRIVRADYGADALYTKLALRAIDEWHKFNKEHGEEVFRPTGVLLLRSTPMTPGSYEYESYKHIQQYNKVQQLTPEIVNQYFPAWGYNGFIDGYYNPHAGWVDNGRALTLFIQSMIQKYPQIRLLPHTRLDQLIIDSTSHICKGIRTSDAHEYYADLMVVACGAWTPTLIPELSPMMKAAPQPVTYWKPDPSVAHLYSNVRDPELPNDGMNGQNTFPVFGADLADRGFYGFPVSGGVIKIGHHGPGLDQPNPDGPRELTPHALSHLTNFVRTRLPHLYDNALLDHTGTCYYCDTWDGHWYMDYHPKHPGLFVAAGGSGHAFKFLPVFGDLIVDLITRNGGHSEYAARFAWRDVVKGSESRDACRAAGFVDLGETTALAASTDAHMPPELVDEIISGYQRKMEKEEAEMKQARKQKEQLKAKL